MSDGWERVLPDPAPAPAPALRRRLATPRRLAAVAVAALVAVAIWAIVGLATASPLTNACCYGSGSTPTSSAFGFGIVNTGRLDVKVTGIDLEPVPGVFSSPRVEVGEPGAFMGDIGEPRQPFEAFTLAPGEERAIILSGRTDCTATRRGQYRELRAIDVHYRVLGLPKTQTLWLDDYRLNPTPEVCDPPPPAKPFRGPWHGRM